MNAQPHYLPLAPDGFSGEKAGPRPVSAGSGVMLTAREIAALRGHAQHYNTLRDIRTGKYGEATRDGAGQYRVALQALPQELQRRYWARPESIAAGVLQVSGEKVDSGTGEVLTVSPKAALRDAGLDALSRAAGYQRRQAEKYLAVLEYTGDLKGEALRDAIARWNLDHPELSTSYPRVLAARETMRYQGAEGLLAKYGQRRGETAVPDKWFDVFKSLYLKEGSPPAEHCWRVVFGLASQSGEASQLPRYRAFLRRLDREVGKSGIMYRRLGPAKHNRKLGPYVERDLSGIQPGDVWVFDHAQVDVMAAGLEVEGPDGKPCIPWLTAIVCMKSQKFVGWYLHLDDPNSDHVFQTLYYALRDFGVPAGWYMDNGKDFRAKDLSGGKRKTRVEVDTVRARSLAAGLGVDVHFALPYNAQAKIIERLFLNNKLWFSTMMPGYRGGNVVEKPEALKGEIAQGKLMKWEDFRRLMDRFIAEVANKMPRGGKVLRGMSPDAYWMAHAKPRATVTPEALRMLCSRVSGTFTIGRNGIRDGKGAMSYWHESFVALMGRKVYMRRDPLVWQRAWVFDAEDDAYLCEADAMPATPGIAQNDIERAQVRAAMNHKRKVQRMTRALSEPGARLEPAAIIDALATFADPEGRQAAVLPAGGTVLATAMDRAAANERKQQRLGTADLSAAVPPREARKKLIVWETDRTGT